MNSKVSQYAVQQLAAAGFAIMSARVAYKLRAGDLWISRMNAGGDFGEALPKLRQFLGSLPGVVLLEIQLDGAPGD